MTFLPIVTRELRVAARRRATYRGRAGAALLLVLVGAWLYLIEQDQPREVVAMSLFGVSTGLAVLHCLLSGIWSTADCLSEEKREGTLGLLFLTDLKGYDVVLGKLVATSLNVFYAVLAVVPLLAVPLLLGGVAPGEFGRMAVVTVNTLFFSLALGMCVSAMCRSSRGAMAVTLTCLVVFTVGLPGCGAFLTWKGWTSRVSLPWLLPSTGFSYYLAFDRTYRLGSGAAAFWWSVAVIHGLGWLFLLLASVIAPHTWQDRPAGARRSIWRERWHAWRYGSPASRALFRRRLLDRNAYFWLSARARLRPAYVWVMLGLVGCVWVWGIAKLRHEWFDESTYLLTGLFLNMIIKLWFAGEAGKQLAEDRKQGALELLLTTPLTIPDILRGQRLALERQFLRPVMVVLAIFFLFLLACFSDAMSQDGAEDRILWMLFWAGLLLMMVADLTALYWAGMWANLTAKNAARTTANHVLLVQIVPWVVVGLVVSMASFFSSHLDDRHLPKVVLALWFGLGLAADFGFGAWARHKLLTQFRLAAASRYEPRAGFWRRLLS